MNSHKCDICNVVVHRATFAKLLRSKNHLEKKQNESVNPEWLFNESVDNKNKKLDIPKSLKEIAGDNIKLDDKQKKRFI